MLEQHMERWFCGDMEAVSFAVAMWDTAQLWDDVVDEKQASPALVQWLAFGMDRDPFFRRHGAEIKPVMRSVYLQWTAANVLERGVGDDLSKAYVLRAGLYGLWHFMAELTGGMQWAVEIGPEIWRMYGETLADFMMERRNA